MQKFFKSFISAYTTSYIYSLVTALEGRSFKTVPFVRWFISTNNFSVLQTSRKVLSERAKFLYFMVYVTAVFFIIAGLVLAISSLKDTMPEGSVFALAIFIGLPIILAIMLALYNIIFSLVAAINVKAIGKSVLCILFEAQVVRLRKKYDFTIVAVVGSVGKTSTKLAVAQVLEHAGKKVQYQQGNYNDRLTVPLVVFGQEMPSLFNLGAWRKIYRNMRRVVRRGYEYDVVVLELGTDGPGQIRQFAYLMPDITIVTAVAEEHMEYFGTLDAVAAEELSLVEFSEKVLLNTDDVAAHYRETLTYTGYGLLQKNVDYYIESRHETIKGQEIQCYIGSHNFAQGTIAYLGPQGRKIVLAAAAVAHMLNVESEVIDGALAKLEPFAGRMQILTGIKDTTLIDDTYNATPAAVEAALHVLSHADASHRVAVLGSMNELGSYSAEAHKMVGASIDAKKISLVVTVGAVAQDYLAPAAAEQGCEVVSFLSPYEAGAYLKENVKAKSTILFKGSQNGVFCEEALKPLLADKTDAKKLVRQSPYWMKQKRKQFSLPK